MRSRMLAGSTADSPPVFAATITSTRDLATKQEERVSVTSTGDAIAVVQRWLDAFVAGDDSLTTP